jgi:hypothetical protein
MTEPVAARDSAVPPPPRAARWTKATWAAIAAIVVLQGAVAAFERALIPQSTRPLRHPLLDRPTLLKDSPWKAKNVPLGQKEFVGIGADEVLDREYTNSSMNVVARSHVAVWLSSDEWAPHIPDQCYQANGWKRIKGGVVSLPERPDVKVAMSTFERSGQTVRIAYWYQMDDRTYVDRSGARSVRRAQWGKSQWPPLIKTLLQTWDGPNAEGPLLDLADRLYRLNLEQ